MGVRSVRVGQTTLIASYLEARKRPHCWYHVDAGDRDPANLIYYFAELAQQVSRAKRRPRYLPVELRPDLSVFARRFFRDFFSRLPGGAVFVLDNCHDAAGGTFDAMLRDAAEELPDGVTLICISRMHAPAELVR